MPEPSGSTFDRRDFLKLSTAALGTLGLPAPLAAGSRAGSTPPDPAPSGVGSSRSFGGAYEGVHLNRVAFPLGGIGAGMICLEGTGALSQFSIRNRPDVFNEPCSFAAISLPGPQPAARVLEGPVPSWKLFGAAHSALGGVGSSYGLPRFASARFSSRFPFGTVELSDAQVPLEVTVTGWSPFVPGQEDASSLPVAGLEYRFVNPTSRAIDAVFSYNARNFMVLKGAPENANAIRALPGGFCLWGGGDHPWDDGCFAATVAEPEVEVNAAWFRGGWFDPLTMAWGDVAEGRHFHRPPVTDAPAPGASLFVPLHLPPGGNRTVHLQLCWYVPKSDLNFAGHALKLQTDPRGANYQPWYAGQFSSIEAVSAHWQSRYAELRRVTEAFTRCFYDSTLPPEVIEAVAANLSILKSPTVLRQIDGRFWAWEGCNDDVGSCPGSCTHVWNYAQALPHLFPRLERTLRETEFGPSQDDRGHQTFRAALPIRPVPHDFHAAADGQLGGIMRVHREWRVSGDTAWLRRLWPRVRQSLDYCIETWDPARRGWLEEPHHNTYDIEFWGADGMCTSIYLGALRAAAAMALALGETAQAYDELCQRGVQRCEAELFNGEYFCQKIEWQHLRAKNPQQMLGFHNDYSPEALALLQREGPKYQYGNGCLTDGVLGAWLAQMCGVDQALAPEKVSSHLRAVYKYNARTDLSNHANPQRPTYAVGGEGGVLLCTWPKGGALALPFVYSNEVWTGIEYQVASHLISVGLVEEGCAVVRTCRQRYDGRVRNPYDEYECGHWYARALASYGLLQAWSGARYDAVDRVLYLRPPRRGDFRSFLSAATGYGTVGVRQGRPFLEVHAGAIEVSRLDYVPGA